MGDRQATSSRVVSLAHLPHPSAMARHRHSLSANELEASLQYAQTYLAADGASEAFSRRRGLRISVAEEAKERRKRIEVELALLSPHYKGQHSAQIVEQLTRLKAEWRKASADERAASQALKSPSLVGKLRLLARRSCSKADFGSQCRTPYTEPRRASLPSGATTTARRSSSLVPTPSAPFLTRILLLLPHRLTSSLSPTPFRYIFTT